ncbi:MAG: hypothetical protein LKJ25_08785 [Clostridia bacterium]|jgi:hypothetical protein|nr:hypothetical protein [Clostridia bacterium]
MLDLNTLTQKYYEVKLLDGSIIHLKHPTQGMLNTMVSFSNIKSSTDNTQVINVLYDLMTRIFNRNTEGVTFTREQIGDMLDIKAAMYVLNDYIHSNFDNLGE